jgi:hypothetical protein
MKEMKVKGRLSAHKIGIGSRDNIFSNTNLYFRRSNRIVLI